MEIFEKSGEYYDSIYRSHDYEKECEALEKIFEKFCQKPPKSILDTGCGTGSHALILSRRGYSVTGIDISKAMIDIARRKAENEKIEIDFFVQDVRNMNLNRKFDCVLCMFGAFPYILTYGDLVSALSGVKQHLNEGGLFIFELWSIGGLKPYLPFKNWIKMADENGDLYRLSESSFNPQTNILNVDFTFIFLGKNRPAETFSETHKLRCYALPEIQQYLDNNEFKLLSVYDWENEAKAGLKMVKKETFKVLAVSRFTPNLK